MMNELRSRLEEGVTPARLLAPGQSTSFINPFSYLQLRARPELLRGIRHWAVDGKSLQALLARAWKTGIVRTSFDYTSLAGPVFRQLAEEGRSLFVLGSDPRSLARFVEHLAAEYPTLRIVGSRHGYFDDAQQRWDVAREIAALRADFVLVGMGAVRQEEFVLALFENGHLGAAATCGGFIHQTARRGRGYYPAWVDRFNLRFAYRMFDEPALIRRYFLDYPRAFALIRKDLRRTATLDGQAVEADLEKS